MWNDLYSQALGIQASKMADRQDTNTASSAANSRTLRGKKRAVEVLSEDNTSGSYECQDGRRNAALAGPSGMQIEVCRLEHRQQRILEAKSISELTNCLRS